MQLSYIIEHIEEFASFIKPDTIDKIIDSLELDHTIYSIKYMLRLGKGSAIKDIVFLVYRINLLVGVCIIEDRKLTHKNSSLDGLDINNYLPKNLKKTDIECKSKQEQIFKNTFLKDIGVPYDNKLTTIEKLDLLQEYINDEVYEEKQLNKEIIAAHYEKYKKDKQPTDKSKEYQREYQKKYREENKYKPKVKKTFLTEEQIKINLAISKKKYYEKNKEKISNYMKELREDYKKITNKNNEKQDEN